MMRELSKETASTYLQIQNAFRFNKGSEQRDGTWASGKPWWLWQAFSLFSWANCVTWQAGIRVQSNSDRLIWACGSSETYIRHSLYLVTISVIFCLNADSSIHLFSCLSVNQASNPMMKVKQKGLSGGSICTLDNAWGPERGWEVDY